MDAAAAQAKVSVTVIRKLIDRKILPARQVVPNAPWMIRASDLECDGVVRYLKQVPAGRAFPRIGDAAQLSLDATSA